MRMMKRTFRNILIISFFAGILMSGNVIFAQKLSPLPVNPDVIVNKASLPLPLKSAKVLSLPFFDDFTTSVFYPDPEKWQGTSTYITNSLPVNPPSYNVAVFDVYNADGLVYKSGKGHTIGDTLTSHQFDLSALSIADSVYLSFYYQVGGKTALLPVTMNLRDTVAVALDSLWPEDAKILKYTTNEQDTAVILYPVDTTTSAFVFSDRDSMIVEFYNGDSTTWERAGYLVKTSVNKLFDQYILHVKPKYFTNVFQFRLINKMHSADMEVFNKRPPWMIDYVRLEKSNRSNMLTKKDLAISNTPEFIFSNNSYAIPWKHLEIAQNDTFFRKQIDISIRNNSGNDNFPYDRIEYNIKELKSGKSWLGGYRFGLNVPVPLTSISLEKAYSFEYVEQDSGIFEVAYSFIASNDEEPSNNSFTQTFESSNYYANDDGTPEMMVNYGVYGSWLASRFYNHKTDTLRAVDIYFTPAVRNLTIDKTFEIWVWKMNKDSLPDYKNPVYISKLDSVSYRSAYNFKRYHLEPDEPVLIDNDFFFIGIRQFFTYESGIGIDMSHNSHNTFGLSAVVEGDENGGWSKVNVFGNLMIRPVMGGVLDKSTGIGAVDTDKQLIVYPQPANNELNFRVPDNTKIETIAIFNLTGQQVMYADGTERLNVSHLHPGVYMLKVTTNDYKQINQKILIAH